MNKKLSKAQATKLSDLLADLDEAQDRLKESVQTYNTRVGEAWTVLEGAIAEFNAARDGAWSEVDGARAEVEGELEAIETLRDEVASELVDEYDAKSDKWQESEAGEAYREWKEKWEREVEIDLSSFETAPDEIEMEQPPELDEPDEAWIDTVAEGFPLDVDGATASPTKRPGSSGVESGVLS